MTNDYLKNYRALGIRPGSSWKQLRQAYKKLVNAWHPDRYQQDNHHRKRLAEEKIKEITRAYKELADYHKKFGVLPLLDEAEKPTLGEDRPSEPGTADEIVPEASGQEEHSTVASDGTRANRSILRRDRLRAGMILFASAFLIWFFFPENAQETPSFKAEEKPHLADTREKGIPGDVITEEKRFSVGSSLGDVYAIQGVPTRTENDVWHYGNSKVYFSRGKVVRWVESLDSPLRTDIMHNFKASSTTHFGQGSTKKEVLAVQGKPDQDNGNAWDYGLSRVYFENDRVTGWQESPINPLKAQR